MAEFDGNKVIGAPYQEIRVVGTIFIRGKFTLNKKGKIAIFEVEK